MPEQTPWRVIALLFLAGALAAAQYAKIPWMLPGLLQVTVMSPVQQALLLSLLGAIGALGGTFAGGLVQRLGLLRTLDACLVLAVAGALLPLASTAYPVLLSARLIEGLGHLGIVVAVPTLMLALVAASDRTRVMTLWSCYFTLTFVCVALVAPALLALAGWQGLAVAHALLLAVVLIASKRLQGRGLLLPPAVNGPLATTVAQVSGKNGPASPVQATPDPVMSDWRWREVAAAQWRLLSQRRLLIIPLTFFGYTLLFVALVSVLPGLVSDSPRQAFLLGFVLPGCALTGTAIAWWLQQREVRPWRMVRAAAAGLLLTGMALLLAPAAGSVAVPLCLLLFLLLGLLPAGIVGSLPGIFGRGDPDVALVNGGLVQFGNLGNFVGAPMLAVLLDVSGWHGIGLYLCAGAGLVLMCLWPLSREVERSHTRP